MVMTTSSYGGNRGRTLKTVQQREPVDLGPTTDFWADLAKMRSRMRPPTPPPSYPQPSYEPMQRPNMSAEGQGSALRGQIPTFVKNMSGPNIVSGYVSAYATDPGAVFHGYVPENAIMPGAAQPLPPMPEDRGSRTTFDGDPFFADYRPKQKEEER